MSIVVFRSKVKQIERVIFAWPKVIIKQITYVYHEICTSEREMLIHKFQINSRWLGKKTITHLKVYLLPRAYLAWDF